MHAGHFGLSWDALNHHVYLGLVAESPRWHLDAAAAASQSYQYPYIYWPFYRVTVMGISGTTASIIWSVFQTICLVPPLWFVTAQIVGDAQSEWESRSLRFAGCLLAYCSILVLAAIAGSANDLLAAVPLLWAIALALAGELTPKRAVLCGSLIGLAVALKFSNVLSLPLFLFATLPASRGGVVHLLRLAFAGVASVIAFALAYAPWGYQLWTQFGNPLYPHLDTFFRG